MRVFYPHLGAVDGGAYMIEGAVGIHQSPFLVVVNEESVLSQVMQGIEGYEAERSVWPIDGTIGLRRVPRKTGGMEHGIFRYEIGGFFYFDIQCVSSHGHSDRPSAKLSVERIGHLPMEEGVGWYGQRCAPVGDFVGC